ncbi:unnamed protein product [Pseudo-nitzschia multistriata]|uniref:Uncharacterized protein n=1 Tax=Pseudo-nitzschia multistriata TaxID=183589 RepID=A0A448Z0L7_9STRA|nr:unnamed protein product [Pseudo-nitzschia multistriata]
MAAVPRNQKHLLAVWSQLECFTIGIDHIVLAVPSWAKEVARQFIRVAKASIPSLINNETSIQVEHFTNDRYDVGLWCDAVSSLNVDDFDEFAFVNDSVFAMRHFSEIFDALSLKNCLSWLHSGRYRYFPSPFLLASESSIFLPKPG